MSSFHLSHELSSSTNLSFRRKTVTCSILRLFCSNHQMPTCNYHMKQLQIFMFNVHICYELPLDFVNFLPFVAKWSTSVFTAKNTNFTFVYNNKRVRNVYSSSWWSGMKSHLKMIWISPHNKLLDSKAHQWCKYFHSTQ